MNRALPTLRIVAANELADSIRSRRVIVMLLLYLAGAMGATALFITFLHSVEGQLVTTLGLDAPKDAGSVTATLWKSAPFRNMLSNLIGDRKLAETLLDVPPLALFYGWLSCAFTPLLVMLTASARVSEEIASGSIRYIMFRGGRAPWLLGKFVGQAAQIFVALILSALGAWIVGWFRMSGYEGWPTAYHMLLFAARAWIYSLPFLGLALGISQLCAMPNLALVFGFMSLVGVSVLTGLSNWLAGDGWRRIWDLVNIVTPGAHRQSLWWSDAEHLVPASVFLATLAAIYLFAGYARFARRDL